MKNLPRVDLQSVFTFLIPFLLLLLVDRSQCAPAVEGDEVDGGCYYMFNHYGEGDRILTNEPCLNCTCHNSMLMCYLRVCPFTKPIGQDCTVEKKPDQCCPVINCPQVPVSLVTPSVLTSTTAATTSLASVTEPTTDLAIYERGCEIEGKYYPDGAQVIGDPTKPCELCYCIRNRTACVMQECILHVEGCDPVFQPGVCCPVRYQCDYPPQITDQSTVAGVITTTLSSIFSSTPQPGGCTYAGQYYADGSQIHGAGPSPCEHCYCMRGELVCAVQECGTPLENEGANCTAIPPGPGLCCPEKYTCESDKLGLNDESATTVLPPLDVNEKISQTDSEIKEQGLIPSADEPVSGNEGAMEKVESTTVDSDGSLIGSHGSTDKPLSSHGEDIIVGDEQFSKNESMTENYNLVSGGPSSEVPTDHEDEDGSSGGTTQHSVLENVQMSGGLSDDTKPLEAEMSTKITDNTERPSSDGSDGVSATNIPETVISSASTENSLEGLTGTNVIGSSTENLLVVTGLPQSTDGPLSDDQKDESVTEQIGASSERPVEGSTENLLASSEKNTDGSTESSVMSSERPLDQSTETVPGFSDQPSESSTENLLSPNAKPIEESTEMPINLSTGKPLESTDNLLSSENETSSPVSVTGADDENKDTSSDRLTTSSPVDLTSSDKDSSSSEGSVTTMKTLSGEVAEAGKVQQSKAPLADESDLPPTLRPQADDKTPEESDGVSDASEKDSMQTTIQSLSDGVNSQSAVTEPTNIGSDQSVESEDSDKKQPLDHSSTSQQSMIDSTTQSNSNVDDQEDKDSQQSHDDILISGTSPVSSGSDQATSPASASTESNQESSTLSGVVPSSSSMDDDSESKTTKKPNIPDGTLGDENEDESMVKDGVTESASTERLPLMSATGGSLIIDPESQVSQSTKRPLGPEGIIVGEETVSSTPEPAESLSMHQSSSVSPVSSSSTVSPALPVGSEADNEIGEEAGEKISDDPSQPELNVVSSTTASSTSEQQSSTNLPALGESSDSSADMDRTTQPPMIGESSVQDQPEAEKAPEDSSKPLSGQEDSSLDSSTQGPSSPQTSQDSDMDKTTQQSVSSSTQEGESDIEKSTDGPLKPLDSMDPEKSTQEPLSGTQDKENDSDSLKPTLPEGQQDESAMENASDSSVQPETSQELLNMDKTTALPVNVQGSDGSEKENGSSGQLSDMTEQEKSTMSSVQSDENDLKDSTSKPISGTQGDDQSVSDKPIVPSDIPQGQTGTETPMKESIGVEDGELTSPRPTSQNEDQENASTSVPTDSDDFGTNTDKNGPLTEDATDKPTQSGMSSSKPEDGVTTATKPATLEVDASVTTAASVQSDDTATQEGTLGVSTNAPVSPTVEVGQTGKPVDKASDSTAPPGLSDDSSAQKVSDSMTDATTKQTIVEGQTEKTPGVGEGNDILSDNLVEPAQAGAATEVPLKETMTDGQTDKPINMEGDVDKVTDTPAQSDDAIAQNGVFGTSTDASETPSVVEGQTNKPISLVGEDGKSTETPIQSDETESHDGQLGASTDMPMKASPVQGQTEKPINMEVDVEKATETPGQSDESGSQDGIFGTSTNAPMKTSDTEGQTDKPVSTEGDVSKSTETSALSEKTSSQDEVSGGVTGTPMVSSATEGTGEAQSMEAGKPTETSAQNDDAAPEVGPVTESSLVSNGAEGQTNKPISMEGDAEKSTDSPAQSDDVVPQSGAVTDSSVMSNVAEGQTTKPESMEGDAEKSTDSPAQSDDFVPQSGAVTDSSVMSNVVEGQTTKPESMEGDAGKSTEAPVHSDGAAHHGETVTDSSMVPNVVEGQTNKPLSMEGEAEKSTDSPAQSDDVIPQSGAVTDPSVVPNVVEGQTSKPESTEGDAGKSTETPVHSDDAASHGETVTDSSMMPSVVEGQTNKPLSMDGEAEKSTDSPTQSDETASQNGLLETVTDSSVKQNVEGVPTDKPLTMAGDAEKTTESPANSDEYSSQNVLLGTATEIPSKTEGSDDHTEKSVNMQGDNDKATEVPAQSDDAHSQNEVLESSTDSSAKPSVVEGQTNKPLSMEGEDGKSTETPVQSDESVVSQDGLDSTTTVPLKTTVVEGQTDKPLSMEREATKSTTASSQSEDISTQDGLMGTATDAPVKTTATDSPVDKPLDMGSDGSHTTESPVQSDETSSQDGIMETTVASDKQSGLAGSTESTVQSDDQLQTKIGGSSTNIPLSGQDSEGENGSLDAVTTVKPEDADSQTVKFPALTENTESPAQSDDSQANTGDVEASTDGSVSSQNAPGESGVHTGVTDASVKPGVVEMQTVSSSVMSGDTGKVTMVPQMTTESQHDIHHDENVTEGISTGTSTGLPASGSDGTMAEKMTTATSNENDTGNMDSSTPTTSEQAASDDLMKPGTLDTATQQSVGTLEAVETTTVPKAPISDSTQAQDAASVEVSSEKAGDATTSSSLAEGVMASTEKQPSASGSSDGTIDKVFIHDDPEQAPGVTEISSLVHANGSHGSQESSTVKASEAPESQTTVRPLTDKVNEIDQSSMAGFSSGPGVESSTKDYSIDGTTQGTLPQEHGTEMSLSDMKPHDSLIANDTGSDSSLTQDSTTMTNLDESSRDPEDASAGYIENSTQKTSNHSILDLTDMEVTTGLSTGQFNSSQVIETTEREKFFDGLSTDGPLVDSDGTESPSRVPGEGSCIVEGKTYQNGSSIPPTTPCHIVCACQNSIVHCLLVHCPPPPNTYGDCKPIYKDGVCCPEYDCGESAGSTVTVTPGPGLEVTKDFITVTPETPSLETSEASQDEPFGSDSLNTTDSGTTSRPVGSESTESSQSQSSDASSSEKESDEDKSSADTSSGISKPLHDYSSESSSDSEDATQSHISTTISSIVDLLTSTRPLSSTEQLAGSVNGTGEGAQFISSEDSSSGSIPSSSISPSAQDILDASHYDDTKNQTSEESPLPPGSYYPVTTTTTVTPSSAAWPYPTPTPASVLSTGACLFDGRVYMSAQQIPRDDPCDFCFCFRGDIICLQQSCPPPIPGCYEEPIPGFCCPRYECPVGNGNVTTQPPLFPPSYYHNQILNGVASGQNPGAIQQNMPTGPGCEIQGEYYESGQVITSTSGPCLECRCGATGMMECDPRECQPEPMLRKMIAAITSR